MDSTTFTAGEPVVEASYEPSGLSRSQHSFEHLPGAEEDLEADLISTSTLRKLED